ncbi:MAG: DUF3658 domain-containing protein [Ferruginibacter sp.]
MTHIVFNEQDVTVLQKAIALDDSLQGNVVQIKDDYAVGPLSNLYSSEGIAERKDWWRKVLKGGDYDGKADDGSIDDVLTVQSFLQQMKSDESEMIWIWAAQNKHDVSGYYWLLPYLKELQGRVFILYLNNLPFINEKGHIFYPQWLHEIPAKEFLKAKKLARQITLSEFEVDPDEWEKLSAAGKGVRLLEGGKKLVQHDYDFYDAELKKYVTEDWQKASKIIHHFFAKAQHTTGDVYLLWRLKEMIAKDEFDVQGNVAGMKDFEIKLKA